MTVHLSLFYPSLSFGFDLRQFSLKFLKLQQERKHNNIHGILSKSWSAAKKKSPFFLGGGGGGLVLWLVVYFLFLLSFNIEISHYIQYSEWNSTFHIY